MNRKWWVLYGIGTLLLVAGLGWAATFVVDEASWTPGVTVENFNRIRKGDSMERVHDLMGRTFDYPVCVAGHNGPACAWRDPDVCVLVLFRPNGTVTDAMHNGGPTGGWENLPQQETVWEMVRRLLGL